jgi:Glycosyl transferase family 2
MIEKIPEREDSTQKIPPNSIEHLYGPKEVTYAEDELVLLCLLRDGRPYLKSFMEHYLSMGVKHLFFMDNGSTDGTVEALKEYDNVTVLQTGLPFKNYETSIRQYLVERFCQKGRWCLYADIDELFDYPYSDVVSLSSLLRYLKERSYTAIAAQMLDMFPEEPLSGSASDPDEPLKERHRFYDISNVKKMSIKEHPLTRHNTYESDDIEFFYGGAFETLFDCIPPWLTRFSLTFSDGKVKPFAGSGHRVDDARVADLSTVYLHYKFLDEHFHKKVAQAVREENYPYDSRQYKRYLEVLENSPSLQLKRETARELRSVNELVENQFLVVSEEYMMLVYEQARKNGTSHALLGDEPDGLEDPAFDRTRARAKVQSLRAKRLERRLEDVKELHQRELEKLRENNRKAKKRAVEKLKEQNKRKVEKLNSRLSTIRKENRNLVRQLQSMRASRSWRLLNRLGSLRARIPGRIR